MESDLISSNQCSPSITDKRPHSEDCSLKLKTKNKMKKRKTVGGMKMKSLADDFQNTARQEDNREDDRRDRNDRMEY